MQQESELVGEWLDKARLAPTLAEAAFYQRMARRELESSQWAIGATFDDRQKPVTKGRWSAPLDTD
jgi:hypothetical protein